MAPRKPKQSHSEVDPDESPSLGRVPYHIKIPVPMALRIERLLGIRMQALLLKGGKRGDASATALFEEAMELLLSKEEKALDVDRTHPIKMPATKEAK